MWLGHGAGEHRSETEVGGPADVLMMGPVLWCWCRVCAAASSALLPRRIRTTTNYQYRYGTTMRQAMSTLYKQVGIVCCETLISLLSLTSRQARSHPSVCDRMGSKLRHQRLALSNEWCRAVLADSTRASASRCCRALCHASAPRQRMRAC